MYHDYHSSMKRRPGEMKENKKQEMVHEKTHEQSKMFICPNCNKNNWKSIETFRMHKSHCKQKNPDVTSRKPRKSMLICSDCGADFISNQDLVIN